MSSSAAGGRSALLTAEEQARIERWRDDPDGALDEARAAEATRVASSRVWAVVCLALDLDTCRSILRGNRVFAKRLDAVVLHRALRGSLLPPGGNS